MATSAFANKLTAYNTVATHGGVEHGDPHRLILMLMDGAMERMAMARGCLQRGDVGQKAQLLQRVTVIVGELRACLDLQRGGPLAKNLQELYDYMERQLIAANADNSTAALNEVSSLLGEIRAAWAAVPLAVKDRPTALR
jgi:flagellar protein FliS